MGYRLSWPMRRMAMLALVAVAMVALAGCSTQRIVEGEVLSHSRLPALPTPATYRIERLPSQQVPEFDAIEALAHEALARAGLQQASAGEPPRLRVQLTVEAGTTPRTPLYPAWGLGLGSRFGLRGSIQFSRGGLADPRIWDEPAPLLRRAVSVVMRDTATQAIVYETSAVHEDIWVSDPAVYGVLLHAALDGFPQPVPGKRRIDLPLPESASSPTCPGP